MRDGVAELARVNPDLEKIIIITEKVSVHDAREIRAIGQMNGIDIFGGNGLGIADAWNRVRIGGALGGDNPGETLLKGSVAIFSNSGNFTTTIANYLSTMGWGTTTSISSGKDVYIHFAAPEFINAFDNDDRSKAAVLYAEPGGYYELGLQSKKPIVACVVGRWKAKLTRAVGHAGAMAGSGDDAASKERWFMEMFGVDDIFSPHDQVCSAKGAVVTNIAHIPMALTKVMALNGIEPDMPAKGDLSLKAWFGNNQGLALPKELDLPVVEAPAPYDAQIKELRRQIGGVFIRQSMKDASGATIMDPATQVTSLHGVAMLDAALQPFESNLCLAVLREPNGPNDNKLANVAIAAHVNLHDDPILAAADAARAAGNAPNSVLAAAASLLGPRRVAGTVAGHGGPARAVPGPGRRRAGRVRRPRRHRAPRRPCWERAATRRPPALLAALDARGAKSVFVRYVRGLGDRVTADAVLAAIALSLAWGPLQRRRISRRTALNLPWHLALYGTLIGASIPGSRHTADRLCGVRQRRDPAQLDRHRARRPGAHRAAARRGRAVLLPGPARPAAHQRPGHDLGPGRQGCRLRRRAGEPGAGADQQGHGRLPDPHRLQPRRQWLRGHPVPARAVRGREPGGSGRGRPRHRRRRPWRPAMPRPTSRRRPSGARPRATAPGRSPASITRCFAASRSTPTRARPSSAG